MGTGPTQGGVISVKAAYTLVPKWSFTRKPLAWQADVSHLSRRTSNLKRSRSRIAAMLGLLRHDLFVVASCG